MAARVVVTVVAARVGAKVVEVTVAVTEVSATAAVAKAEVVTAGEEMVGRRREGRNPRSPCRVGNMMLQHQRHRQRRSCPQMR